MKPLSLLILQRYRPLLLLLRGMDFLLHFLEFLALGEIEDWVLFLQSCPINCPPLLYGRVVDNLL